MHPTVDNTENNKQQIRYIYDTSEHKIILTTLLGEGGYGRIWLAQHPYYGQVAIKELKQDKATSLIWKRFEDEAQALIVGNIHQNIITIFDYFKYEKIPYIVMEYCPQGSLDDLSLLNPQERDLLKGRKPLKPLIVIDDIIEVCNGLEYLHSRKIVHGDIKPSNLLRGQDEKTGKETLKLANFGQSFVPEEYYGQEIRPRGDRYFAAPENLDWRSEPNAQSDIYSLGATLYILLTGKPYLSFSGDEGSDLQRVINRTTSIKPPHKVQITIPLELSKIVERALEVEPSKRYDSAAELRNALEEVKRPKQPQNNEIEPHFPSKQKLRQTNLKVRSSERFSLGVMSVRFWLLVIVIML
jgi:serine/threonine-protein kinase